MELRDAFLKTRLVVTLASQDVDLDRVLSGALAATVRPFTLPLWIITAWHPWLEPDYSDLRQRLGQVQLEQWNRGRQSVLQRRVDDLGIVWAPAVGSAPDGSWAEPSVALSETSERVAVELGREFGQCAIFRVDESEVLVVATDLSYRDVRRRMSVPWVGNE